MNEPLITTIMPAYNAANYIREAVESMLRQTHSNWELIIVNDGSTDDTKGQIALFTDPRIRYFEQQNKGVGAARNLALENMRGEYFCFLDADDVYTPNSLQSRINVFKKDETTDYVDGAVIFKTGDMTQDIKTYTPSFEGQPYPQLLRINTACLFGNTWMIKRKQGVRYQFNTSLAYSEDLFFYLTITEHGGQYRYTHDVVLWYRRHAVSAMQNTKGLEKGYRELYRLVKKQLRTNTSQLLYLKYKISRIMFATYLKGEKKPLDAFRSLIQNLAL
ncbi:MAG: glycosyltransferase family 2 protein [Flavisolibacter sp.]